MPAGVWHHVVGSGSGPAIVLLHGIGMSHVVWDPVAPLLSPARRVVAFDIAGFGRTPPLPDGVAPTVVHLVDALETSIRGLEIPLPVDFAGNSLGGLMALEAARRGIARTATAISPPGLWARPPRHVAYVFRLLRALATRVPRVTRAVVTQPLLREVALSIPISRGTRRMPVRDALQLFEDLADAAAFEDTFRHTSSSFSARDVTVPVSVAFGSRDWIVTRGARLRSALPAHARWVEPRGWGHVPMWSDPAGVARLILECAS